MARFTTLIRTRTLRVAGAVAAFAVAAPFTAPATAAEKIIEVPCNRDKLIKGPSSSWQKFPAPRFEPGLGMDSTPQQITSYAVDPSNTGRVIVTNGKAVYTSRDGGCAWTQAIALGQVPDEPTRIPLSGVLTTIRFVYIAPGGTYYAVAEELETGASVGRPHVLRSETGMAASWQLADDGLPPVGKPLTMRANESGSVVYLTFSGAREESQGTCPPAPLPCEGTQEGRRLGLIYASTNRGTSWQPRSDANDLDSASAIRYLAVDDDDPNGNVIWVVANGLLRKSTTGGRSFTIPDGLQQSGFTFTAVESMRKGLVSRGLDVVAFGVGDRGPGMIRLEKGRWIRTGLPFHAEVQSVAQRPSGDIAVATTSEGGMPQIWRAFPQFLVDRESDLLFKQTMGWQSITPSRRQTNLVPADLASGDAPVGASTFYLRERDAVLRFLGSSVIGDEFLAPGVDIVPPEPPRGRISPSTVDLDLQVGKSRTIDYTLTLPPSPTPLDVYLLVDNSGSMVPFINDLKDNLRDIAVSLNDSGINVGIGIGSINVQPNKDEIPIDNPTTPNVDESKPRPIYERLRRIGPVDRELFRQLSKLAGNAGPGDEPQLEALYQAVHGTGLGFSPPFNYLGAYSIPRGQDAGFRDELSPIKVIVHATDENFTGTPEDDGRPDEQKINGDGAHNSIPPVARALVDANVKQIGLSMDQTAAQQDLEEMARLTGAVAPRGGTDCDGDGRIGEDDVRPGRPLVCGQSEGLDKTLVNLLKSLSDPQTITLAKKTSPAMVDVSREEFRIDAKQATRVRFSVTYSCKGLVPGQYFSDLSASLRGDLIAKTVATVTCGGLAVPAKPPAAVQEPPSNPPPVQPQPLVPAPVPVNPVPQPQTQVQAQTQVNPQAGMADQEEQQFQLATALNELQNEQDLNADQLAMSRLSHEDAALGVLAAGMAMSAAFGVGMAVRRRSRTASAKVTTRR